ncbi:MAG: dephospho-CoA kinase [Chloroflexota bacterium]|nr:dephospho-CoA kinase [Chloroflexota bacterium]
MFVIGLTGGIGSGKSTVSDMLRAKGAAILYADQIGHEVYRPGTPAWEQVVAAFGRQVVAAEGQIDRRKLGQIVFGDPQARQRLNAITHPPMRQMMADRLEELRQQGAQVVVLEAALLIEAGWADLTDEVWVTVVSPQVAAQRSMERSGLSRDQAEARIASQLSNDERVQRAQAVIDTDCSLEEVARRVDELWDGLVARLTAKATQK